MSLVVCVGTVAAVCPLDPGQRTSRRSPGDGGFQITLSGDPASFVAQSVYVGKNIYNYIISLKFMVAISSHRLPTNHILLSNPVVSITMSGNKYEGIIFSAAGQQVSCHSKQSAF